MNTSSTDITVLKSLIAVRLDVTIWSARKKLTVADFGTINLPPEKLASLGSKKICDPASLKIFNALKSRAVALLNRVGVRFLGGWAIPQSRIKEVIKGLSVIEQEFAQAKDNFLADYNEAVRRWIADNPGWEEVIARSVVGVNKVRSRIDFGWQVYQVSPPKKSLSKDIQSNLAEEVSNLGGTLFDEVAKAADETWLKSYVGKSEVGQKAVSSLHTLRTKLAGLSFIEPTITPIVELMDNTFSQLPDKGAITGVPLTLLQGLICLLRDPEAVSQHGKMMTEGQTCDEILQGFLASPDESTFLVTETDRDAPLPCDAPFPTDTRAQLDSYGLW